MILVKYIWAVICIYAAILFNMFMWGGCVEYFEKPHTVSEDLLFVFKTLLFVFGGNILIFMFYKVLLALGKDFYETFKNV